MRSTKICLISLVSFALLGGCSSGSSGSGTGGMGGTTPNGSGGSATASGGAGGVSACGVPEAEPNDTRATATAYVAGAAVVACVSTGTDVDFYEFTAPATDLAGGYYDVGLDDVGPGYVDLKIYSASDNGEIDHEYSTTSGASVHAFFAAAPGQQYRVAITTFSSFDTPYLYTLKATYTKVADTFEPNDTRATAKPITVATPITATFFAGYTSSMLTTEQFDDFYKVTLAAGTATVKMADTPTDLYGDVTLLDSGGASVDHAYATTKGANVTITMQAVTAGDYFIHVASFAGALGGSGAGIMLPDHFTHPYTLTVSQP